MEYKKGCLRKLVKSLRKQGIVVNTSGAVYQIYAKIKEFGGLTLREKNNAFGSHVAVMVGYWDDGAPHWISIKWDEVLKQVNDFILAE